jgi:AcrR family transcriptional regulator
MTVPLPNRSPKVKRHAETTKAAILEAALREFAEQGLAGARMEEIARAAAVNKALLYYYFESKERLFAGVIERTFVTITDALRRTLNTPAGPREKLRAFIEANFEVLNAQPLFAQLLGQELVMLKTLSPETIRGFREGLVDRVMLLLAELRAVLEEGVRTGVCRSIDIDAVLPLLIMAVRTASRGIPMGGQFFPRFKKVSAARRRAAAIDFIESAIFTSPSRLEPKEHRGPKK